jgi:diaminopimelate decarboxylase
MPEGLSYEAPRLTPLTFTAVSKHLTVEISSGTEFAEPYSPEELMAEFGSPLFVVSETALRGLYRNFHATFSEPGIETRVAYSYKTNYLPAICAILHEEGAAAEVVSGMEYALARSLDVPPQEIIFNGPYKTRDELETALGQGALVNIDNFDELALVEQVAASLGRAARVGIRVNFRYGPAPWTKFGFNDENGDAQAALKRIAAHPNLAFQSLHNHCGTFQLVHDIYAKAIEALIKMAKRARDLGLAPTIVDLGGGFPSNNRLKPMYDLPDRGNRKGDTLFPYAEAILGPLGKAAELFGGRPTLMLEPGRAIVDSAVQLLSTVVAVKDIPDRGKAAVADAGVNLVPTAYWYDHKVAAAPAKRQSDSSRDAGANGKSRGKARRSGAAKDKLEPVSIFGPLCMQIDVLRDRAMMAPLHVGDPLVISNVGAYCQTQSMQFIQPRPATVLIGPKGPEIIRRRETARDIFALDSVPERFKPDGWKL